MARTWSVKVRLLVHIKGGPERRLCVM